MKRHQPKALNDQVIVITGASSGIGLATAKLACHAGAKVVLSSRNKEDLEKIAEALHRQGGDCIAVEADVSRYDDLVSLKKRAVEHYGRIDTWINNAGVSIFGYLKDSSLEEEKKLFETNFWGIRNGSQIALPELEKSGGVLINLGSEVSARSIPLQGIYSASKHAVKAYTDALRMELEKEKVPVSVCLVRPAGIDTPYTEHAKNELHDGAPSLPDPVYDPHIAAEAILNCAVFPKRDVYVGGTARLFTVLEGLVPRALDIFMEAMMFKQQSKGTRIPHTSANEGLMNAPHLERRIRGGHKGRVITSSLYTNMKMNPVVPWALIGLGVAAWGMRQSEG